MKGKCKKFKLLVTLVTITSLFISGLLNSIIAETETATVTVSDTVIGVTPMHIGLGQSHYLEDTNVHAWHEYSGINIMRYWMSQSNFEETDDISPYGDYVTDLTSFDERKALLRANPEDTTYIDWDYFEDNFESKTNSNSYANQFTLNYVLENAARLDTEPMLVVGPDMWASSTEGTWEERWELWQYEYAVAYYCAKNYDVELYEIVNEPDHGDKEEYLSQSLYIEMLQYGSDAIRCAIEDVNSNYSKSLTAQISAPVLAHASNTSGDYHMDADPDDDTRDDTTGWGELALENIRTDYYGDTITYDIFDIFGTHKYQDDVDNWDSEGSMLIEKMEDYSPVGEALPVYYTEYNVHNTSSYYNHPEYDFDKPEKVTNIALASMRAIEHDVTGLIAFKFGTTYKPGKGIAGTGHYYMEDDYPYNVNGVRLGGEFNRMLAKGFKNERDRYEVTTSSTNDDVEAMACYDSDSNNYYVMIVNPNDSTDYDVTIDLSDFDIEEDNEITVEELSDSCFGGVVETISISSTETFTINQPADSVWLLTIPKGTGFSKETITSTEDAYVTGGEYAETNYGNSESLFIEADSQDADNNSVSYLKFDTSDIDTEYIQRVLLKINGSNIVDSTDYKFYAYYIEDDSWSESTITWDNAPNLYENESKLSDVGYGVLPVGVFMVGDEEDYYQIDITDYVKKYNDDTLSFVLIKEKDTEYDIADDNKTIFFSSSESSSDNPCLEITLSSDALTLPNVPSTLTTTSVEDETSTSTGYTILPEGDTYIKGGTGADVNYGDLTGLVLKDHSSDAYTRKMLMKFDLSEISGSIDSAQISIYGHNNDDDDADTITVSIYELEDDSWSESDVTWNTAPTTGDLIETLDIEDGDYYTFDVTSFAQSEYAGDKTLSVIFEGMDDEKLEGVFWSKEHSLTNPVLLVETSTSTLTTTTLSASEDAYVRSGDYSSDNYGSELINEVKDTDNANNTRKTYIKFDISDISSVSSAALRLYCGSDDGNTLGVNCYSVEDDTWDESTITWDSAPDTSGDALDYNDIESYQYYEFDVTSFVSSELDDGIVTFELEGVNDESEKAEINSLDSSSNTPELVIVD